MRHFYFKEILSNAYIVNGAKVPFESIGNNRGAIVLDDANPANAALIKALDEASAQHRGGVVKTSEAEWLKKKREAALAPSTPLKRKFPQNEPLRVMPSEVPRARKNQAAAVPAAGAGAGANRPFPPPPTQPAQAPRPQSESPKMDHLAAKRKQYRPRTAKASQKANLQVLPEPPK